MLNKSPDTDAADPYARARPRTPLQRLGEEVLLALTLLTRLPAPRFRVETHADLGSAFWAYPAVGGLVGLIGGLAYLAASAIGLGAMPAVVAAIVSMLMATGCFHEDGLADFCDGVGGGQSRRQKLEIMRDSRIGTYGAAALFGLLAMVAALFHELAAGPWVTSGGMVAVFVFAGALQRAAIGLPLTLLDPARADGLAADAPAPSLVVLAAGWSLPLVFGALSLGLWPTLAAAIAAMAAALFVAALAERYLDGRTGDALGATASLAGVAALAALVVYANGSGAA